MKSENAIVLPDFEKLFYSTERLKILVLGDKNTGKSTFLANYCNEIGSKPIKNIGCTLHLKKLKLSEEKTILIEFWEINIDLQNKYFLELYLLLPKRFFSGIFFFFDINNIKSLYSFTNWIDSIYEILIFDDKKIDKIINNPFLILANKCDFGIEKTTKNKILSFVKDIFYCGAGENIIYVSKEDFNQSVLSKGNFDLVFLKCYLEYLAKIEFENKKNDLFEKKLKEFRINTKNLQTMIKFKFLRKDIIRCVLNNGYEEIVKYMPRNIIYNNTKKYK